MKTQQMWVHFHDEVYGINSGRRLTVVEVGRKWVYLKVAGKNRRRVRRNVFDLMEKKEIGETP